MRHNRDRKKKNRGFTLIEVIVCFALIGIFMSAVGVVLAMFMEVSMKNTSISQAEILAGNIVETISSELTSAADDSRWHDEANTKIKEALAGDTYSKCSVLITDDDAYGNNSIYFANKINTLVKIKKDAEDTLSVLYGNQQEGNTVDWDFGSGVYMGNLIKKLHFKNRVTGGNIVIQVELEVENQRTGYIAKRTFYVECYNISGTGTVVDGGIADEESAAV